MQMYVSWNLFITRTKKKEFVDIREEKPLEEKPIQKGTAESDSAVSSAERLDGNYAIYMHLIEM